VLWFVLARAHHSLGRGTVRCRADARRRWSGGVRGPGSVGHGCRALGCAQSPSCSRGRAWDSARGTGLAGVGNVVVTVALPCTSAAATAALPRWAGMATGDIRVTMTGESAGTASTATRTPGMESVLAIADATLIPGTMTTEGDTAEASEASAAAAVTVARPAGRVWRQGI